MMMMMTMLTHLNREECVEGTEGQYIDEGEDINMEVL